VSLSIYTERVKLVCAARESSLVWAVITNTIGSPPEIFWGDGEILSRGASRVNTKNETHESEIPEEIYRLARQLKELDH
jgi:hypothetical protein